MNPPVPTRLFHITALANLQQILQFGGINSKNGGAAKGIKYVNIAHQNLQSVRAGKGVPNPPGGVVHDYVPFYFAPRSPMLSAIHNGTVAGCNLGQDQIIYFETTVDLVCANGSPFVFYDRNASLGYATAYTDLNQLTKISWDLLLEYPTLDGFCKYFFDRHTPPRYMDRCEKRMAEFHVSDFVPLAKFTRIGVYDANIQAQAVNLMGQLGVNVPVKVIKDWYF